MLVTKAAYSVADPNKPGSMHTIAKGTPLAKIAERVRYQLHEDHFVDDGQGADDPAILEQIAHGDSSVLHAGDGDTDPEE